MEFTKDIYFDSNPTVNEDLTITYNGFLSNSQEVSIVFGYGDSWENTSEIKMEKTENGFVGTVNMLDYDTFNFCFKNSNGEWDNNSYCNYITGINPAVNQANTFDIDALIEELLFEPVINIETTSEQPEESIDLAYQLSNLMAEAEPSNIELEEFSTLDEILTASKIENTEKISTELQNEQTTNNIEEFNEIYDDFLNNISFSTYNSQDTVEEVQTKTEQQTINMVQPNTEPTDEPILQNTTEDNNAIFEDFINNLSSITSKHQDDTQNTDETEQTNNTETSLTPTSDSYIVSSRQASSFYLFKKRIKLAFYKVFVKLPKMLLGIEDED